MNTHPVIFIAFEEFDNLGVGYLVSLLSEAGYKSKIIDFHCGKKKILETLKKEKPLIVGFSLIFQYHINEFKELISYLRKEGIKCHFTAGGYYASLRFDDLFKHIPSLDSIVRFEGEYPILELVNCIQTKTDWRKVKNIAFKDNGRIIANALQSPEEDLDKLPFPERSGTREYALGKKFATIIAGRGCVNNCSFCNTREYFKQSLGPYKRLRSPENVVRELEFLFSEKECSVFLFEDDDFPVNTKNGSDWIKEFCNELKRKKLVDKIIWKINCRPDEVEFNQFSLMKRHGLYLVFLGIDDGTDIGLSRLNKHMTIKESLHGIDILKRLEISFDYGFMLFQPTSTFKSVSDNLDFLTLICGDGYTPLIFLKLRPYFDTLIEKELRKEGRLKGKPGFLDYDFLNISLNHFHEFLSDCLTEWLRSPDGFVNLSRWARNYATVFSSYNEISPEFLIIKSDIKEVVSKSNLFLLDTMKKLIPIFESGKYNPIKYTDLTEYRENIIISHAHYKERIINSIKQICNLDVHQKLLQMVSR